MNHEGILSPRAGQRQLFLDDHGIERLENLTRTMHQPVKKGAVIRPDRAWESVLQTRSAPAWDPDRGVFKLWLLTSTTVPYVAGTTFVESKDGIHWTKPALGQYELDGSKDNNFVTVEPDLTWPANAMENVVRDPDDPDPPRRYKGLGHCSGRQPIVSPDGIRWKRLDVPPIPSSDESNMSYDRETRTFIATVKHPGPHGRSVFLCTSRDFEHWTEPELIFHADDLDQELGRSTMEQRFANPLLQQPVFNTPAAYNVDIYNMGIFRYEDLYIGLPSVFHQTGRVAGDWPGFAEWDISPEMLEIYRRDGDWSGFHHVQLTCSRDLRHWQRLGNRRPFIDNSPMGDDVYDRACIIGPSFPVVRDDELWFYYTGIKQYGGPSPASGVDCDNQGAICLAVLRRDGFLSVDAAEETGALVTRPLVLLGGSLFVNVEAPSGTLRVEIIDEKGKCLAASELLRGDHAAREVLWRQGNLEDLRGQIVRFRFVLRQAQFYSYWLGE